MQAIKKYIEDESGEVRILKRAKELGAITTLVTPDQKKYIEEQATKQGVTTSDMAWALVTKAIQQTPLNVDGDLELNVTEIVDDTIETMGHKVLNRTIEISTSIVAELS